MLLLERFQTKIYASGLTSVGCRFNCDPGPGISPDLICRGLSWSGPSWSGLSQSSSPWSAQSWSAQSWSSPFWSDLSWSGLVCSGPVWSWSGLRTVRMFWKNTAWSWDDAAGTDDDDGGYLLAADLRRTPESALDTDLNHITSTTTKLNRVTTSITSTSTSTSGLRDLTNHSLTSSCPQSLHPTTYSSSVSTLNFSTTQCQATTDSSRTQRLTVSPRPLSHDTNTVR